VIDRSISWFSDLSKKEPSLAHVRDFPNRRLFSVPILLTLIGLLGVCLGRYLSFGVLTTRTRSCASARPWRLPGRGQRRDSKLLGKKRKSSIGMDFTRAHLLIVRPPACSSCVIHD